MCNTRTNSGDMPDGFLKEHYQRQKKHDKSEA